MWIRYSFWPGRVHSIGMMKYTCNISHWTILSHFSLSLLLHLFIIIHYSLRKSNILIGDPKKYNRGNIQIRFVHILFPVLALEESDIRVNQCFNKNAQRVYNAATDSLRNKHASSGLNDRGGNGTHLKRTWTGQAGDRIPREKRWPRSPGPESRGMAEVELTLLTTSLSTRFVDELSQPLFYRMNKKQMWKQCLGKLLHSIFPTKLPEKK